MLAGEGGIAVLSSRQKCGALYARPAAEYGFHHVFVVLKKRVECVHLTYTGLLPPPRLSIDTLAFPLYIMIHERPYKIRGDICIGVASIFSYVLPASPRLATPTPSQLCGSHAAHLRTRQRSRLKSSSAPILSFLL